MGSNKLSLITLKTITKCIKDITHSGCFTLDDGKIKSLINFCKSNEGYIEHSFSKLMLALKEEHSEVRYTTVLLCDKLFDSFEKFRSLLIESLDTFISLTFPFEGMLPLPNKVAAKLIELTIGRIHKWYLKHGCNYPRLEDKYNFLQNSKHVDFEKCLIFDPKKRQEERENSDRNTLLSKELLQKTNLEIKAIEPDLRDCVTSVNTCLELLIPHEGTCIGNSIENNFFQLNEDGSFEIKVTSSNESIVESLKESISVITKKYLPKVNAWLVLIDKGCGDDNLKMDAQNLLTMLEDALQKYSKIDILYDEEDEVSTDSDLEEVQEAKPVISKKAKSKEEYSLFERIEKHKIKLGTGNSVSRKPHNKGETDESDRKNMLLKVAPQLRYDSDLYSWGESSKTETLLPTATDGHRFWAASEIDQVEIPKETRRVIEFVGEFKEVQHTCRVKLPSGKLCPRQDRFKCPFHGKIIPRDKFGNSLDDHGPSTVKEPAVPDWQDPALLARLKAETGIDLTIAKGKRKTKESPLTNIKKTPSSKDKLSKKIFNKKSVKRVARVLDSLDYRRHRDKFGDQFNYSYGSA